VKSSPHKQTNKQAVRRGGDRKTANFDPQTTQKSLKFGINLKRSTQQKQQEPKAREKSQSLRENHDQIEAIKNGSELELLQRSRWRQGLCLWAPALV